MELFIERLYFGICAVVAIAGALGTIAFPNPIRGAMSLLFCIVAIAGFYLQLHAPFLAAIQLIVYAGAIVVLFLFVIMLLGPDAHTGVVKDGRASIMRAIGGLAAAGIALQITWIVARKVLWLKPPSIVPGYGSIDAFGEVLFQGYLVPFEVASFLLMVAIVGAFAVARGKQPAPEIAKGSAAAHEQPARDGARGISPALSAGTVGRARRGEEAEVRT